MNSPSEAPLSKDEEIEEISRLNNAFTKSKKRQINELLYPIDDETLYLASLFYLNNYEISEWEETYLRLWIKNPEHSYILTSTFFRFLNISPTDLLIQFFSYTNFRLTINNYLQFVILLSFVSIEELLPCFFSISGIYSKLSVTSDQIHIFLRNLNSLDGFGSKMREFIKGSNKTVEGRIPIKDFKNFLISNINIFNNVLLCRDSIIENVITKSEFKNIERRNTYYNSRYNGEGDGLITEIPNESCFNKFYRILFLKEPSPYHYDYNFVINYERMKDNENDKEKKKDKNIILLEQYIHRIMMRYHKNLRNGSYCQSSKYSNRSMLRNSSAQIRRTSGLNSNYNLNGNTNLLKGSKKLRMSTTPLVKYGDNNNNNNNNNENDNEEDNLNNNVNNSNDHSNSNHSNKKKSVKQGLTVLEGDEQVI